MKIDRGLFLSQMTSRYCPQWPCPSCEHGHLNLINGTLKFEETYNSSVAQSHPGWEPDWLEEVFVCLLKCQNKTCEEIVASLGITSNEFYIYESLNNQVQQKQNRTLVHKSFYPPIPLFRISRHVPEKISSAILQAFRLFWIDNGSCVNRIRTCIELILSHKGVKSWTINKSKKRTAIALHHRIELFERKQPAIAKSLMAIKWIGNAGSHEHTVSKSDLFDGFDILKYLLEEIFEMRTKSITDLGKRINKKRGPLSKVKPSF